MRSGQRYRGVLSRNVVLEAGHVQSLQNWKTEPGMDERRQRGATEVP